MYTSTHITQSSDKIKLAKYELGSCSQQIYNFGICYPGEGGGGGAIGTKIDGVVPPGLPDLDPERT